MIKETDWYRDLRLLKCSPKNEDFYILVLLRSCKVSYSQSQWSFFLEESQHFNQVYELLAWRHTKNLIAHLGGEIQIC